MRTCKFKESGQQCQNVVLKMHPTSNPSTASLILHLYHRLKATTMILTHFQVYFPLVPFKILQNQQHRIIPTCLPKVLWPLSLCTCYFPIQEGPFHLSSSFWSYHLLRTMPSLAISLYEVDFYVYLSHQAVDFLGKIFSIYYLCLAPLEACHCAQYIAGT